MYGKRFLPLFILIIVCLTLISYQVNKNKDLSFHFLSTPFFTLNGFTTSILDTIKKPFQLILLRDKENKRLEAEVKKLLLERQSYREVFLENQRLREILSLREREKRYVTTARVISKSLDPFIDTIIIDKGRLDGVSKDMAVITPLGLIGKVISVEKGFSKVLLLDDTNFSVAVKIQESRQDAILSGNGSKGCVLKYVGQEYTIKKGDTLITSGFDDLFPEGIPVGYVTEISKKDSGFFQAIEVKPFQDLARLDEVIILRR